MAVGRVDPLGRHRSPTGPPAVDQTGSRRFPPEKPGLFAQPRSLRNRSRETVETPGDNRWKVRWSGRGNLEPGVVWDRCQIGRWTDAYGLGVTRIWSQRTTASCLKKASWACCDARTRWIDTGSRDKGLPWVYVASTGSQPGGHAEIQGWRGRFVCFTLRWVDPDFDLAPVFPVARKKNSPGEIGPRVPFTVVPRGACQGILGTDRGKLGIRRPSVIPRATEHVPGPEVTTLRRLTCSLPNFRRTEVEERSCVDGGGMTPCSRLSRWFHRCPRMGA